MTKTHTTPPIISSADETLFMMAVVTYQVWTAAR
jgi:hypothetical protein